jgi:hypothetical protein
MAFSPGGTNPKTPLPLATIVSAPSNSTAPAKTEITQRLEAEVQKMLAAGPLRPGYHSAGFIDLYGNGGYADNPEKTMGEIFDYFQNPADTVYTLLLAYPHLSSTTQQQVKSYLQTYYGPGKTYDFTRIVHVGWGTGPPEKPLIFRPIFQAGGDSRTPRPTILQLSQFVAGAVIGNTTLPSLFMPPGSMP